MLEPEKTANAMITVRNALHACRCETVEVLRDIQVRPKRDVLRQILESQREVMFALETIALNVQAMAESETATMNHYKQAFERK